MNRRILTAAFAVLILAIAYPAAGAEVSGQAAPIITQSFASREIQPGDTWKVYINASDPKGNMKYIYAEVEQPGSMGYPLSMTRIKPENRKELSGYIYLNTVSAGRPLDNIILKLVVHLGDGRGNFSAPAVFPLEFSARAISTPVPEGVFQENNLGPVMIRLRPSAGEDGQSGSGSFGN